MPWATDLLPHEIEEIKNNLPNVQKKTEAFLVLPTRCEGGIARASGSLTSGNWRANLHRRRYMAYFFGQQKICSSSRRPALLVYAQKSLSKRLLSSLMKHVDAEKRWNMHLNASCFRWCDIIAPWMRFARDFFVRRLLLVRFPSHSLCFFLRTRTQ